MKTSTKIAIVVGIVIAALIGFGVYGAYQLNMKGDVLPVNTPIQSSTYPTDINSTLAAWKKNGLNVSDNQGAYYQIVGAKNGGKYDVGPTPTNVELYEFADATKLDAAKDQYFTSADDTVLVTGTLLVDIHSTDPSAVDPIENVFKEYQGQ